MLHNTFCHVPGISVGAEQALWAVGTMWWDDVENAEVALSRHGLDRLQRHLVESRRHLAEGNSCIFANTLPANQHWRLLSDFRGTEVYLDIETAGLGGPGDYITTIALYDGQSIRHIVHGQNLKDFARDIREYRLAVTYNGKCFDLPFIRRWLGLSMTQAHIALHSLRYTGGLEGCEKDSEFDHRAWSMRPRAHSFVSQSINIIVDPPQ